MLAKIDALRERHEREAWQRKQLPLPEQLRLLHKEAIALSDKCRRLGEGFANQQAILKRERDKLELHFPDMFKKQKTTNIASQINGAERSPVPSDQVTSRVQLQGSAESNEIALRTNGPSTLSSIAGVADVVSAADCIVGSEQDETDSPHDENSKTNGLRHLTKDASADVINSMQHPDQKKEK